MWAKRLGTAWGALCVAGLVAGTAQAQGPKEGGFEPAGRNAAADPRADQPLDSKDGKLFQPQGIEWGDYLVLPRVDVSEVWNSNVFAAPTPKGDAVTQVHPEIKLRSRFDTHAFNLSASADVTRMKRYTADDRVDGQILADGRYDLTANSDINALALVAYGHEDRGSPDDAGGKAPTPTHTYDARLGASLREVAYKLTGSLDASRYEFENVSASSGARIVNTQRNRDEFSGTVKAGYEFMPNYSAEIEGIGNARSYDSLTDSGGFRRDSQGYRLHGGLGVEIDELIRGDVLVGWMQQFYRDPRLATPSGPSARISVSWTPTRLLLVAPSVERSVQETTKARAAAMVRNNFSLMVRWEYLPDVLITNTVALNLDEYQGVKDNDAVSWEDHLRVMYAITREWHVGVTADYQRKFSDAPASSFAQKKLGLTASVQF